jgi:uncharacterized protein YdiU (UPF0061 family)
MLVLTLVLMLVLLPILDPSYRGRGRGRIIIRYLSSVDPCRHGGQGLGHRLLSRGASQERLTRIASQEFEEVFFEAYNESRRRKLGLARFERGLGDADMWNQLEKLLTKYIIIYKYIFISITSITLPCHKLY